MLPTNNVNVQERYLQEAQTHLVTFEPTNFVEASEMFHALSSLYESGHEVSPSLVGRVKELNDLITNYHTLTAESIDVELFQKTLRHAVHEKIKNVLQKFISFANSEQSRDRQEILHRRVDELMSRELTEIEEPEETESEESQEPLAGGVEDTFLQTLDTLLVEMNRRGFIQQLQRFLTPRLATIPDLSNIPTKILDNMAELDAFKGAAAKHPSNKDNASLNQIFEEMSERLASQMSGLQLTTDQLEYLANQYPNVLRRV